MKTLIRPAIILAFSLVVTDNQSSNAQGRWRYHNTPSAYTAAYNLTLPEEARTIASQAYDLTKSLPPNCIKDGSVDYTKYLQAGINKNKIVMMPDFPVMVNKRGLKLGSGSTLIFNEGSKVILQPTNSQSYHIIGIQNVSDVVIYSPVIEGDRDKHIGNEGQWGMGISIKGSQNVKIVSPRVSKCWGDGIYIGATPTGPSQNILVTGAILDDNRRNGLSIVSGRNIHIIKPVISNTNGQNPMSGIDIEPNTNTDVLEKIKIDSPITYNNQLHGIIISSGSMKGPQKKNIDIVVNKHIDDSSSIGLGLSLERAKKFIPGQPLAGNINIVDPVWKNNSIDGFRNYASPNARVKVMFKNISILKGASKDLNWRSRMIKSIGTDKNITLQ